MNYMKQIATDILGLYWDDEKNESEAFKIKEFYYKYKITPNGVRSCNVGAYLEYERLTQLLMGELEIERIPWKPRADGRYYFIKKDGEINCRINNESVHVMALIKCGWAFRTEEEAKANKEHVLKEMREVLDE